MADATPLTAAEVAAIRSAWEAADAAVRRGDIHKPTWHLRVRRLLATLNALQAQVETLNTTNSKLAAKTWCWAYPQGTQGGCMDILVQLHDAQDERDAYREIVEAVAKGEPCYTEMIDYCPWCEAERKDNREAMSHSADCPVTRARALLAQQE